MTITLIDDVVEVAKIAKRIQVAGEFAIDLEFVSEGRYIPDLALMQLAWRESGKVATAIIDCVNVDASEAAKLVADDTLATVIHSGRQDLQLLHQKFGVVASNIFDTQIAAAFLGMGEQLGLAKLLAAMVSVKVDKSQQFTKWTKRPLTAKQLDYALSDVLHLLDVSDMLQNQLDQRGRRTWCDDEAQSLIAVSTSQTDPETAYLSIRGHQSLKPKSLGALAKLAALRANIVAETNQPPSWVIGDKSMIEACRRLTTSASAIGNIRGVKPNAIKRWGKEMAKAIEHGKSEPIDIGRISQDVLSPEQQSLSSILVGIVAVQCAEEEIANRFVATKKQIDKLTSWATSNVDKPQPDLPVLSGWRLELVGQALLDFLAGKIAIVYRDGALRFSS